MHLALLLFYKHDAMVVLALVTAGWSLLNYLHLYCAKYLFEKGRKKVTLSNHHGKCG